MISLPFTFFEISFEDLGLFLLVLFVSLFLTNQFLSPRLGGERDPGLGLGLSILPPSGERFTPSPLGLRAGPPHTIFENDSYDFFISILTNFLDEFVITLV